MMVGVQVRAGTGGGRVAGLVLAPGAGSGRDQPGLVAISRTLEASGVHVERIDFPYRLAGRRAPDRPPVLIAAIVDAAERLGAELGVPPDAIALGGRSMGGRIASMVAASGRPCAALVLVSYPLHPPGRPERLRVEHFPGITVPALFVSGSRDAFGTPAELAAATAAIPGPVERVVLDGGDHGLGRHDEAVASAVAGFLDRVSPPGLDGARTP